MVNFGAMDTVPEVQSRNLYVHNPRLPDAHHAGENTHGEWIMKITEWRAVPLPLGGVSMMNAGSGL